MGNKKDISGAKELRISCILNNANYNKLISFFSNIRLGSSMCNLILDIFDWIFLNYLLIVVLTKLLWDLLLVM